MQITSVKRETDDGLLRGTSLGRSSVLSRQERSALEGAFMSPRLVNAHVDLAREGERTDNLFLIIQGWACRYTTTREGGRQLSALMLPGDLCNLDSLLFERLNCSVRTLMPATIVALPRESALALAAQHPGIARTFTWLAFVENAILGKLALTLGSGPIDVRGAI
jgi:CRP-like cAMP-binding protein